MNIVFKEKYKSISRFNEIVIEDFSVLIGKNGSGKTHLLKAINEGSIQVDGIQNENISYFNFQSFLIKNQQPSSLRSLDDEKSIAWNRIKDNQPRFLALDNEIRNLIGSIEYPYKEIFSNPQYTDSKKKLMARINLISQDNNRVRKLLKSGILESSVYVSEVVEKEFKKRAGYEPDEYELLESLSEMFVDYQKKIILSKLSVEDGGDGKSNDEIIEMQNNAPWNFINTMFREFGLEHVLVRPTLTTGDLIETQTISFQAKLKIGEDIIDFEDLSSGEKILCSLAITVYQDNRSSFPELLLLDEIDASLHPSICQNLLNVIENVFIKRGSKVILATHSPTTAALVNEKSLFEVLQGSVENKIKKISQIEAIDTLSDGYATFEEGLKITNALDSSNLQILTEGKNVEYLKKAISVMDNSLLPKVNIVRGSEGKSGKQQLKNAFDVMKGATHHNKFLFVWDCDAKDIADALTETQNFKIIYFEENIENTKCIKEGRHMGIEDLFSDELFTQDLYRETVENIEYGGTTVKRILDKDRFLEKILTLDDPEYFKNFEPFIEKIKQILEIQPT